MIERLLDKETAYLFGHKIECRKGKEGAIIRLDGKRISLKDGQSVGEAVRTAMKEKVFGDYERIHESTYSRDYRSPGDFRLIDSILSTRI